MLKAATGEKIEPWMRQVALYVARKGKVPGMEKLRARAAKALGVEDVPPRIVTALLENPLFQTEVRVLTDERPALARALAEEQAPYIIGAHIRAIRELEKNGQHKEISKFTNPFIDRFWPKADGPKAPAALIQINLGREYREPVEAEIVSIEEQPPA